MKGAATQKLTASGLKFPPAGQILIKPSHEGLLSLSWDGFSVCGFTLKTNIFSLVGGGEERCEECKILSDIVDNAAGLKENTAAV